MSDLDKALGKALDRLPSGKKNTETQKPVSAPDKVVRGRGGHIQAVTPYSKRVTLDLTPEQDRQLAVWSIEHGTKKNRALRALIDELLADESTEAAVLRRLAEEG